MIKDRLLLLQRSDFQEVDVRPVSVNVGRWEGGDLSAHVRPKELSVQRGVVYGTILKNCTGCEDFQNGGCTGIAMPIRHAAGRGRLNLSKGSSFNACAYRLSGEPVTPNAPCANGETEWEVCTVEPIGKKDAVSTDYM